MRRINAGWTLIELLVVIGVIAILIGLLLPALASARSAARATKCLAHTRVIAVAMQLYADDDARGLYPTARMPAAAPIETSWTHLTRPYVDTPGVYRCPSDASDNWHAPATPRFTSYGINAYFTPNHPPYYGVRTEQIRRPSQTIIAAELVEDAYADHFMPMFWGSPPAVTSPMMQSMQWDADAALPRTVRHTRHAGESANYVFTDGHAAAHAFGDTWRQLPGRPPTTDWYDLQ